MPLDTNDIMESTRKLVSILNKMGKDKINWHLWKINNYGEK